MDKLPIYSEVSGLTNRSFIIAQTIVFSHTQLVPNLPVEPTQSYRLSVCPPTSRTRDVHSQRCLPTAVCCCAVSKHQAKCAGRKQTTLLGAARGSFNTWKRKTIGWVFPEMLFLFTKYLITFPYISKMMSFVLFSCDLVGKTCMCFLLRKEIGDLKSSKSLDGHW